VETEWLGRLEEHLWPKGYSRDLWMLVDAARDPRIYGLLLECFYSDHTCLFAGPLAPELVVVAPYLVQLTYDHQKTRKFIRQAWGNSWGVFVKSDTRLEALRRHFRTFLLVRDESGKRLMFRYYDPRVLRIYLPTCWPEELKTVFGPIEQYLMEDDPPETLLGYSVEKKQLVTRRHSLDHPPGEVDCG
jgi:Domain of unknown function (DUF4123)